MFDDCHDVRCGNERSCHTAISSKRGSAPNKRMSQGSPRLRGSAPAISGVSGGRVGATGDRNQKLGKAWSPGVRLDCRAYEKRQGVDIIVVSFAVSETGATIPVILLQFIAGAEMRKTKRSPFPWESLPSIGSLSASSKPKDWGRPRLVSASRPTAERVSDASWLSLTQLGLVVSEPSQPSRVASPVH